MLFLPRHKIVSPSFPPNQVRDRRLSSHVVSQNVSLGSGLRPYWSMASRICVASGTLTGKGGLSATTAR